MKNVTRWDQFAQSVLEFYLRVLAVDCSINAKDTLVCLQGGMYVFNLFDYQTGGISLLFVGFCEAAFIGWAIGK